jgi:sulfate-transporting ATPase
VSQIVYYGILGLAPGAMLGLLALGLVVVYRGTGVLNLAQTSQAAVGAYMYYEFGALGLPYGLALILAVLSAGICGVLVQVLVMRRLRNASVLTQLIAMVGVLIVIQSALLQVFGSSSRNVVSLLPRSAVHLWGNTSVGEDRLLLVAVAVAVTLALWALYRFTLFGTATAAVAENPIAGSALGLNPDRLAIGNWFLGGAVAGLAGALLAPISGLDLVSFISLLLPVLAAALGGGLVSFPLTVAAGFVIGIAQSETDAHTSLLGADSIAVFAILVIFIVLRGRAVPARGFIGLRLPSIGTGRIRWWLVAGSLAVALLLIWVVLSFQWNQSVLASMLVAIPMLSVVVVTGYAGQLSLAQFALTGAGAVITATIASHTHIPLLLLLLIGGIGAIPVGIVLALMAMRMRGASLAVITLGFNVLLFSTVFSSTAVVTVPSPVVFGFNLAPLFDARPYLTLVIAVFAILAIAVANLRRAPSGRRLIAVRSNERAASSIGVSVNRAKIMAFSVSAFIAAVGGVLTAFQSTAVVYSNFDTLSSVNQLAWTVIGGVGYVTGPLLGMSFQSGGIGTQIAADIYSDQFTWLPLIGGVAVLLTVLQNPDGIAAVVTGLAGRLRRSRAEIARKDIDAERAGLEGTAATGEVAEPVMAAGDVTRTRRGLKVDGVSVSFGGVHVLKNVSLEAEPGQVHGLIGPNGAGKTTLLDVISGFVSAGSGTIQLGDTRVERTPPWRRSLLGLGRSFQSLELFDSLTVYDNLRTASEAGRRNNVLRDLVWPSRQGLTESAWEAVRLFGLEDELTSRIEDLNYAKRHLVAIARAVANDADVILLDEPAAGLDEAESAELRILIRRLAEQRGHAVLLIEHNVDLVMSVSDVVTALNFGDVIASGSPQVVRSDAQVIASYLGEEVPDSNDHSAVLTSELGTES